MHKCESNPEEATVFPKAAIIGSGVMRSELKSPENKYQCLISF